MEEIGRQENKAQDREQEEVQVNPTGGSDSIARICFNTTQTIFPKFFPSFSLSLCVLCVFLGNRVRFPVRSCVLECVKQMESRHSSIHDWGQVLNQSKREQVQTFTLV